jgi:hypothetical protein
LSAWRSNWFRIKDGCPSRDREGAVRNFFSSLAENPTGSLLFPPFHHFEVGNSGRRSDITVSGGGEEKQKAAAGKLMRQALRDCKC